MADVRSNTAQNRSNSAGPRASGKDANDQFGDLGIFVTREGETLP
jgi:hypothetical protein